MKTRLLIFGAMLLTSQARIEAAEQRAARPNILFIITDQQFADAMSCRMGKQFIHTPAIDRLAQGGTLFTRAYSSNPLCMPWRTSAFTGRYPHETRVTQNAEPPGGLDPQEFVSLGNYFRNAGYDAAYSGKWHLCFPVKDVETHGFEIVTRKIQGDHDAGVTEGAADFLARPSPSCSSPATSIRTTSASGRAAWPGASRCSTAARLAIPRRSINCRRCRRISRRQPTNRMA